MLQSTGSQRDGHNLASEQQASQPCVVRLSFLEVSPSPCSSGDRQGTVPRQVPEKRGTGISQSHLSSYPEGGIQNPVQSSLPGDREQGCRGELRWLYRTLAPPVTSPHLFPRPALYVGSTRMAPTHGGGGAPRSGTETEQRGQALSKHQLSLTTQDFVSTTTPQGFPSCSARNSPPAHCLQ